MDEKFHYISLILKVHVPNGVVTNIHFGPFNNRDDAEEWAGEFGLDIGLFTEVTMVYPNALYPEPIS